MHVITTVIGGNAMFVYTALEAIVGIVVGILLATHTKKAEGVTYGALDKVGRITNILLLVVYTVTSPLYLLMGMLCGPDDGGILGIIGWTLSIIVASASLFCSLGLGFSVRLRKQGRSKLSFALQFVGFAAIALAVLLFCVFYGGLLGSLN